MTAAGVRAVPQNLKVYDGSMAEPDGQHVDVMAKAEIGNIEIRLPETGRSKLQNEWPQSGRQFFVAKRNLQYMTNGNQQAGSAIEETSAWVAPLAGCRSYADVGNLSKLKSGLLD